MLTRIAARAVRRVALRALAVGAAFTAPAVSAQAPDSAVYVRDAGPGDAGRTLRAALARPHVVVHQPWNTPLYHGRTYDSSVVVLSSDASVAGTVRGDVVVVNGSLNLTATARIEGRALAFGGNIYDAAGAVVTGGRQAYPAARFDMVRTARGLALDYRGPPPPAYDLITLPGLYGVRPPLYDRVDGLAVGWNPELILRDSALLVSPSGTYRSNLGLFDAAVTLGSRVGGAFLLVTAARTTRSNDGWMRTDIANSFTVLCCGHDLRNYWRADFGEGRAGYRWADSVREVSLWGGARTEDARSVSAGGPWSITGDQSVYSMLRPNPPILRSRVSSWLAGAAASVSARDTMQASVQVEVPFAAPGRVRFVQVVLDADGQFPTLPHQRLEVRLHAIATSGDSTPPQRYGYLGGPASVPTLGPLSQGGDALLFVEGDYRYTFDDIHIPYADSPSIALAFVSGAAGVGTLPRLTNNVGARLGLKPLGLDAFLDPATGRTVVQLVLWFGR